jgi:glucuronoarabinoxylan endo-1,4-beta-xylanase
VILCSATARCGVTVAQNLGPNWVGTPTLMVADQPSVNLNSAESSWGSGVPSLGQSFTAPVSGTLTNIQMYVTGKNTTNVLYLYDMGVAMRYAASQPSPISPGSNGVSGNLLSSNLWILVTNMSNPSVMQLAFSGADAVPIIGGHEYYFALVSLSSGSQMYWYRDGGSTDLYSGGAAYRQNSLINGSKTTDFSLAVTLVNTSAAPTVYHCVVDWTNVHQRIDGFGASSAWRSGWTPTLADMFFSTNSGTGVTLDGKTNYSFVGIGLSLLRSRIVPGGTTWENSIMQYAQARGARVWSAPWSPDGKFKSATNWNGGTFVSTNNQAYATQLAGYVVNMQNTYGVNITALSVQNEPSVAASYESCQWTAQQIHDFVPYLRSALNATNKSATKIIVAEDEHWQTNYYATALADAAVATNVDIVACHNYDNSPPSGVPAALPRYANTNAALWETETSKLAGNGAFDPGIADGMYWATRIHLFMTVAEANAWHYWWLISNNPDNEGLTDSNAVPAKRMYVLGQYSRFVRPDSCRIDEGNNNPYAVLATAYKDPVSGNFAIVMANTNAAATNQSFRFTNFTATTVTPWITSSNLSLVAQSPVAVSNSTFSYVIPGMSIVTFVGQALTNGTGAPVFLSVQDQNVNPGATLLVTNVAVDLNVPPMTLTFTLLNSPTNATLTPLGDASAVFSWTPLQSQADTTNLITVVVTNNGTSLSATNSFHVIVNQSTGIIPTVTSLSSSITNWVYGTAVTFTATISPAPTNGETVAFMVGGSTLGTGVLNNGVATYTTSGTQLGVTGSPFSVSAVYAGDGNYQNSTSGTLSETVAPATVTVASGLAVNSRLYNGGTSATISSNNVLLSGVVGADTGSVKLSTNNYTATFASRNAGTGIAVTTGNLSLSGGAAGNYSLNQPVLSGIILPAAATLAPGSGSMKITNYFTSSNNQFEVYNGNNGFSPALNGALFTNFQCDVRFAPGSATQTNSSGDSVFGHLQFGTRTSSYGQDYFGGSAYGIDVPATNTGWVHVSIPISVTNDSNLASINNLLIHIYGPAYSPALTGPSTLWVDNIAFTGPTTNYIVDQFNPAGSGGNSYSGGALISVWNNWFGAGWVTNIWDSTSDAIGVAANDKVYDGATAATITAYDALVNAALSGVLSGDLPNVSLSTNGCIASFAGAGVGSNLAVTVSGLTLAGSAGGNYAIAPVTLTASISRLAVTASAVAYNKVYDGRTNATLSTILAGAASGDDVALGTNGYSASFASLDVGTGIAVAVSGWTLTGGAAGNYTLLTPPPSDLTADIMPATVTVTADNQSRTCGLSNPVLTASYNGFANGEGTNVLMTGASLATVAGVDSAVGDYPITAAGAAAVNYVFNYVPGTLTVVGPPELVGRKTGATRYQVTFPTLAGQLYQLEFKANLTDTLWTPLGDPIAGTGGSWIVTNDSGDSQRFFRLRIQQP